MTDKREEEESEKDYEKWKKVNPKKLAKKILKNHRAASPSCVLTFTEEALAGCLKDQYDKGWNAAIEKALRTAIDCEMPDYDWSDWNGGDACSETRKQIANHIQNPRKERE